MSNNNSRHQCSICTNFYGAELFSKLAIAWDKENICNFCDYKQIDPPCENYKCSTCKTEKDVYNFAVDTSPGYHPLECYSCLNNTLMFKLDTVPLRDVIEYLIPLEGVAGDMKRIRGIQMYRLSDTYIKGS